MTRRGGSIRWLARSRTVMTCAGIFLSVSALGQSDPAASMPGCFPTDQQAALTEPSPARTLDSKRARADAGIAAAGAVIQEITENLVPGAGARRSPCALFSQSVGLFSDTLQFVSLPATHADEILRGRQPGAISGASVLRWRLCNSGP